MNKRGCLLAVLLSALVPVLAYKFYAYRFEMQRIPDALAITGTRHQSEQNWGFGPGANETGFVVYTLSPDSVRRLHATSAALTSSASIGAMMGNSERQYGDWRSTPVAVAQDPDRWGQRDVPPDTLRPPRIRDYLGIYGFDIAIDPGMEAMADRVISAPGSYYAYGAGGALIVVAPRERVIIFAYAG